MAIEVEELCCRRTSQVVITSPEADVEKHEQESSRTSEDKAWNLSVATRKQTFKGTSFRFGPRSLSSNVQIMIGNLRAMNSMMSESEAQVFTDAELEVVADFLRSTFLPKWRSCCWKGGLYRTLSCLVKAMLSLLPLITAAISSFLREIDQKIDLHSSIDQALMSKLQASQNTTQTLSLIISILGAVGTSSAILAGIVQPGSKADSLRAEREKLESAWNEFVWDDKGEAEIMDSSEGNSSIWKDSDGRKRSPRHAFKRFVHECCPSQSSS